MIFDADRPDGAPANVDAIPTIVGKVTSAYCFNLFPEAVAALSAAIGSDRNQAQRFLC
jgi:hypothetical protein